MVIVGYIGITLTILCFLFICHTKTKRNSQVITTWPIVGMFPGFVCNTRRLHDYVTQILKQSGGTFEFKSPWFSKMDFIATCDPKNVDHILNRSFSNYIRGPEIKEIFEILGDGIFNLDFDLWKLQKKMVQSMINNTKFELLVEKTVTQKVIENLVPVLDHLSEHGLEADMQDLFQRFTFDNICMLILGFDPRYLSVEFPEFVLGNAIDDMEEAQLYRHIWPAWFWKLQKWLQIGKEKRLKRAWDTMDSFLYQCIYTKKENLSRSKTLLEEKEWDLLTVLMTEEEEEVQNVARRKSDKFLRDFVLNLLLAGSDSTSAALTWFFWLVATNPSEETQLLEEIKSNLPEKEVGKWRCFSSQELNKFVYLHAALCETLRMYPSLPINHRTTVEADILPSGHRVPPRTSVMIPYYTMGRMEEIWGEDCLEFKPGRWITDQGRLINVPSYKFTAFNSGPKSCPGKNVAFIQMKIAAIIVLQNYRVQVVEGHSVSPSSSVLLHMHGGMKVRITKRCFG
ncbi:p450 domain-containing protein [Cephalotus follicularis]|uniref:p450 domain-containing protein n=1 Tax=Cephalotus follicularis TaxID=3775 RepID=A0A1Q3AWH5_CEPFO|nr:p450 domain-containing protein [Cephalotus follicularis]